MKPVSAIGVLICSCVALLPWPGLPGPSSLVSQACAATLDEAMIRAKELEQAGRLRDAAQMLDRAGAARSPNVEAIKQLGLLHAKMGEFETASGLFQRTLSRNPEDLFARLWLGITRLAEEDLQGAFSAFHRLAQIRPETEEQRYFLANAYYYLGAVYSFRREQANALKALEAARRANPRDAETHFRLGALYQDLGKLGVAEAEYLETLKLNERHVKALNALGWFYYNQDQADQARRMWERTLRFSPMNNEARDSLAKLYNDQALKALDGGRKGDAKRLWKKVLEYDPKNRAARYHMNKHG